MRRAAALCVVVIAGLMVASFVAHAQTRASRDGAPHSSWQPERTPDGQPDFQGVWANNTVTPLQRPKQWEGKTTLTDAEIAALQKVAARIDENDGDA
ncbi:MAG TPA: hypothetical protein VF219_02970, partial [Vicinamibacterales bacterium]